MNELARKIDPMEDFKVKLQERVRNDIRDLLPEDAVAALVQKAIEEEFFKPRKVESAGYSGRMVEAPSWFVSEVIKAAEPMMRQAVSDAIAAHPDMIDKVVRAWADTNKLTIMATDRMTGMLGTLISDMSMKLQQQRGY
jgi:hypothetical protein